MTKQERIVIALDTATAWNALCRQQYHNAQNCKSYAQYQEVNSDKLTSMTRCEWFGKNAICELLKIDLFIPISDEVTALMDEAQQFSTAAWEIYREFADYPYHHDDVAEEVVP